MPHPVRLHRSDRLRQPPRRVENGHDARRRIWRGGRLQSSNRSDCLMADTDLLRVKPEHEIVPRRALDVEVARMTKRFGAFTALDDVSMHVTAGSFHALLGENGAGQSTLVKCLVGFYEPTHGLINVDQRERTIRSPHDS